MATEISNVRRIIRAALKMGYNVSLNNGGDENEIDHETKFKVINANLMASDEDFVTFYNGTARVGMIQFVYGNSPSEVVCDHSDNEAIRALVALVPDDL